MTPQQYVQCLDQLLWHTETVADALGCDESLTEAWAMGLAPVPQDCARWLEALTEAHQTADHLRPANLAGASFAL